LRLGHKTGLLCQIVVVVVGLSTAKWTGIDHCAETDAVCRLAELSTAKWAAQPVAMNGCVDSMGR
jgi:hypothetical protein